jgi:hypothetical protein
MQDVEDEKIKALWSKLENGQVLAKGDLLFLMDSLISDKVRLELKEDSKPKE